MCSTVGWSSWAAVGCCNEDSIKMAMPVLLLGGRCGFNQPGTWSQYVSVRSNVLLNPDPGN